MTDSQYFWRLLSESFDRELSNEEKNRLEHFMAEHETPREFEEFFRRIRGCAFPEEPGKAVPFAGQRLGDQKKSEIQSLLESAMNRRQDSLSNRDVVFACELVNQGAISLGRLTEKISAWDSDSRSFLGFLESQSALPNSNLSEIDSRVSETIFTQTLDQTILDEVVSAIKQRVPADTCTIFESAPDDLDSFEFFKLLDKTIVGETRAFESLLDRLINESRLVILQARMFSQTLRIKPVVDEITLRLVGRKKMDQDQLGCYYRNVGSAIRKLFQSDPQLGDSLLPSIGTTQVAVKQIVDSLKQLASEEPGFVQMFNLRFFAGLTVQQVASLLGFSEQKVSAECGYGIARLMQLINA